MSIFDELDGAMVAVVRPDGTRLNALDAGKGPAIVLVHGYGVSSQEFSLVQPALVDKGYRVIAYDQRGHGVSTIGREGASSSALFADLEAVVERFDLVDVILVGRGMGAFTISGALASTALRDRTRAVVLAAQQTGTVPRDLVGAIAQAGLLAPLARRPRAGAHIAAMVCGPRAEPEVIEATRRALASGRRAASGFVRVMQRESVATQLSGIEVPMTVVTVPGAGRMLSFEAPEALVDAIVAASAGPGVAGGQPAGSRLARGVSR